MVLVEEVGIGPVLGAAGEVVGAEEVVEVEVEAAAMELEQEVGSHLLLHSQAGDLVAGWETSLSVHASSQSDLLTGG